MIDKLLTFYTPRMAIAVEEAPEADKPRQVAVSLEMSRLPIQLLTPEPVTPTDLALAHHPDYVAAVLAGSRQTGFGYRARSADLAATLPTGAYPGRRRPLGAGPGAFGRELFLSQAGPDAGAVLPDAGLSERACRLFEHAARLRIPVAWCIGGGYEQEPDGSTPRTIDRHIATFRAALRFARPWPEVEPEESMVPL